MGLSSLYTAKVLGKLKESKVVRSEQGCYGGYRMASPAEKVSVYEVFIAMEGDFVLYEPCLLYTSIFGSNRKQRGGKRRSRGHGK